MDWFRATVVFFCVGLIGMLMTILGLGLSLLSVIEVN